MSPVPIYKRVDNPIPIPKVFSGWGGAGWDEAGSSLGIATI